MAKQKQGKEQQQQQQGRKQRQGKAGAAEGGKQQSQSGSVPHYSSYLQVLATDIDHNSPSVLVAFNHERYLFNAGEGLQRKFRERKIKLAKVDQYFFTRLTTETLGGLPGMVLSSNSFMTDAGGLLSKEINVTVSGPTGLQNYVSAFLGYVNAEDNIKAIEFGLDRTEPLIQTPTITISPICISMRKHSPAAEVNGAAHNSGSGSGGADGGEEDGSPAAKRQRTDAREEHPNRPLRPEEAPDLVAYALKLAPRPGKFDPQKAKALGVQPGPLFGQLQRGLTVQSNSGRDVYPHEVMDPPTIPGPAVLILDVPSMDALKAVQEHAGLSAFVASCAPDAGEACKLNVAVTMAPLEVAQSEAFKEWQASFGGGSWRHIIATPGQHQMNTIPRAAVFQAKLNCLHPDVYPDFKLENALQPPLVPVYALPAPPQQEETSEQPQPPADADGETTPQQPAAAVAAEGAVADGAAATAATANGEAGDAGTSAVEKKDAGAPPAAAAVVHPGLPLPPVLLEPGSATACMSMTRMHLMPPNKQGLDTSDLRQAEALTQVKEALRAAQPAVMVAAEDVQRLAVALSEALADSQAPHAAASDPATAAAADAPAAAADTDMQPRDNALAARDQADGDVAAAAGSTEVNGCVTTSDDGEGEGMRVGDASGAGDAVMAEAEAGAPAAAAANTEATTDGGANKANGAAAPSASPSSPPPPPEPASPAVIAERARALAADVPEVLRRIGRDELEVTFLGTASSQPSKYRNVSATYIDRFGRGGMLMDCGEDAMGQMKRRFGVADAERRLMELHVVFVSHMHADHHGGLYRLLEWRARRGAPPLLIIGPMRLFEVLVNYSSAVPLAQQFLCLHNRALLNPGQYAVPRVVMHAYERAKAALGLRELMPFEVYHIHDSHGLKLVGDAGWKVVFSADTRPCPSTVRAAEGADMLVHEATFEASMQADARAKKHSTTAEAVTVGEQAKAYRTVLTHFSTRYPTLPEFDHTAHPSVAVAMDFMTINLKDLPWLPSLLDPLGKLLKAEEEGMAAETNDD